MKINWRSWLTISAVIVAAILIVAFSDAFQSCMQQDNTSEGQQAIKKGISVIFGAVTQYKRCTGYFLEENSEALIASFTIILAISTIYLWSSTKEAADAARISAEATRSLVDQEYRSYLFFKEFVIARLLFQHPDGSRHKVFRITPMLQNFGKVPAIVTKNNISKRTLADGGKFSDIDWSRSIPDPIMRMPIGPGFPMPFSADIDIEMDHAIRLSQNKERYFALFRMEYGRMNEKTSPFHIQVCFEIKISTDPIVLWDHPQIDAAKAITFVCVTDFNSAK